MFEPFVILPMDGIYFVYAILGSSGVRKIFVTSPRFQDGVPAALGTVVVDKNRMPYVKPYPSWEWFKEPRKCKTNRIVSVYRIMVCAKNITQKNNPK